MKISPKGNGKGMRIICSWCRGEGQIGLVGEKVPLEDRRETHGICTIHRLAVQARWRDTLRGVEGVGRQLAAAAVMIERFPSEGDPRAAFSATHLWVGLKNLARKIRT
jgi:hypothetical protein